MNYKKDIAFFILALLMYLCGFTQQKGKTFSKEFSFTLDNDIFLLADKDGYYTNGIGIKFSSIATNNNPNIIKKINTYEAGQLLFTQEKRRANYIEDIDRPVAGYLYAKFSQSRYSQKNKFWQWGVSVGTIGKSALGQQVISFVHRQININSPHWAWIWDYQVKDEPGVNIHGDYAAAILKQKPSSFFQLTPQLNGTLGTTFSNLNGGAVMQLGRFNKISESGYWNSRLENKTGPSTDRKEVFFFYHPYITYQLYDATVQGGLFRKDKGPIISSIEPFMLQQEIGIAYCCKRFSTSFNLTYQTKEASSQRKNAGYGRLKMAYRFR